MSLFRKIALAIAVLSVLVLTGCTSQEYNMTKGVTEISKDVYELHMIAFWVCVVIGVGTFGTMFWSMWFHRKSNNPKPATFSHSTTVEIIWTTIPLLILLALAWPAVSLLIKMEDPSDADMTILVRGHQWKWEYKYIDGDDNLRNDVGFFSTIDQDHRAMSDKDGGTYTFSAEEITDETYLLEVDEPLVIPVNKKVKFLVTAKDVIHSFWIPEFSVKKDAVPGLINDVWTKVPVTGTYRGVCAELCGKDHGFMPIVVKVVEQTEFDEWYAAKVAAAEAGPDLNERSMATLMSDGEAAYNKHCAACHGVNGQGGVGASFIGSDLVKGDIKTHMDIVINGQNTMPAFGAQLTPAEIAAIVTYERNAWGNDQGDMAQPQDVHDMQNDGGEK